MSYFVLADYLIPPLLSHSGHYGAMGRHVDREFYESADYSLPRNFTLTQWSARRSLEIAFYAVGHGVFLIRAGSQRDAYETAIVLQGLLQVLYGYGPDYGSSGMFLHRIAHVPRGDWSEDQFHEELRKCNSNFVESDWDRLRSGVQLDGRHLEILPAVVNAAALDHQIAEALVHFLQSRSLFYGFMVGSYYHLHYRHDRKAMRKKEIERVYFEYRARFELAFVSAFKAIEALFGGQIRSATLNQRFTSLAYQRITAQAQYKRFHEIFRGEKRRSTYRDMIVHFLNIRNATAAHSNRTPPARLMVSEDSLYEIQWFVCELVIEALRSTLGPIFPKSTLPVVNAVANTR